MKAGKVLMWPVWVLLLRPLIRRNHRLREAGKLADEWYWADLLAMRYGYFVEEEDYYDLLLGVLFILSVLMSLLAVVSVLYAIYVTIVL